MRKILFYYALATTLLLAGCVLLISRISNESARLRSNQQALLADVKLYRTSLDESVAEVEALSLKCREYRKLREQDAERIRRLGLRLRHVESIATHASRTIVEASAPLHNTLIDSHSEPLLAPQDTARIFTWRDAWVEVEGLIRGDTVSCRIISRDTLRQIVHRVPHRWLFFRFGTKAIRQQIISSNPHTEIVYSEYIELPRARKRRR